MIIYSSQDSADRAGKRLTREAVELRRETAATVVIAESAERTGDTTVAINARAALMAGLDRSARQSNGDSRAGVVPLGGDAASAAPVDKATIVVGASEGVVL